jgi:hypothetical protein
MPTRSGLLSGELFDLRMRPVAVLAKVTLIADPRGPPRLLRGLAETDAKLTDTATLRWLRIRRLGLLRIVVTAIESSPGERLVVHFSIRSLMNR